MKLKKFFLMLFIMASGFILVGCQGEPGIKGEKGDRGDQGLQGETGEQGEKGEDGKDGAQGQEGPQGIQGETGEKGDKGEDGKELEFRINADGVLQQRYVGEGDDAWKDVLSLDVIAKWSKKYDVVLDVDGGTYEAADQQTKFEQQSYQTEIALPKNVTKDGYVFKGWTDGKEVYTETYKIKESVTLKAVYGAIPYKVTLDPATGTILAEVKEQYSADEKLPMAYKFGSNFLGWYEGDEKIEKVTKEVALTAKFEEVTPNALYASKTGDEVKETVCIEAVSEGAQIIYAINEKGCYTISFYKLEEIYDAATMTPGTWIDVVGTAKYHSKGGGASKYADEVTPTTITVSADQTAKAPEIKPYVIDMEYFDEFIEAMKAEENKILGHYITIKHVVFTENRASSTSGSGYTYAKVSGNGMKLGLYYTDAAKDVVLETQAYTVSGYIVGANKTIGTQNGILRISGNVIITAE